MRLSRSCTAYVVALLGVVGFIGASPAVAVGDAPWAVSAADNDFGSARPNYSYAVDPGGQVADALVVANRSTTPLKLAVYAADAFTNDAGQVDLLTKDAKSTGVGAWVHPKDPQITVAPGKSAQIPFTLDLPADAAPGDYLGGIVTSLTEGSTDRRLGLRIRLRVGGPLKPALSIENLHLHYPANPFARTDATVTYTIHNTGNAILAARQTAAVSAPFNWLHVPADQLPDSPQLLPGDTWQVTAKIQRVASALRPTTTIQLTPLLTDASGSTAPLTPTTTHAWTLPWIPLLALIVLLALGALLARRLRRTRAS